jgi:hypothetical protein
MTRLARRSLGRRWALAVAAVVLATARSAALDVEILRSVSGLPPHIVGLFAEPIDFQQTPGGPYYVFDRRGHTVYMVDSDRGSARKLIEIGQEQGRIIQPRGFDVTPTGSIVVADAPRGTERVQLFGPAGLRSGGFNLPGQPVAAITLGTLVLNGIGSIQFAATGPSTSLGTGERLLISHPESGSLITEYSQGGVPQRAFGMLRPTGFEQDRALHVALNTGLPLPDPTGGYYYVFLGGRPLFRKYRADGSLQFERHIEGPELDGYVSTLPTRWPTRRLEDREVPFVQPAIKAAAVDPQGRLWVSLNVPFTYVYDRQGDKVRTVQFSAAGTISPTSLFFTQDGRLLVTPGCYEFRP